MSGAAYAAFSRPDPRCVTVCSCEGCPDAAAPWDVCCEAHLQLEYEKRIDACDALRIFERRRALETGR